MTNPQVLSDEQTPDFLTNTEVARIFRIVYGGQQYDSTERMFAAEIEAAVRAKFARAIESATLEAVRGQEPVAFASRVQDLLHLLSFAEITTPTPTDKSEAEKAMADLRHYLRTHPSPTQPPAQAERAWLPIETAPKDGTVVILGRAGDDDEVASVVTPGHWLEAEDDGVDYMGADAGFVDEHYQEFRPGRSFGNPKYMYAPSQPTHWMPLPPPPAALKGQP